MSENSWKLTDLGAVAHIEMGQAPSSEYVTDREMEGACPFLQGNAEFTDAAPRARLWCSRFAKSARAGDSLISVRAPVGELNQADQDYAIGRGLAAIRFQSVLPRYGYHQLALRKTDLHRVAQGSTFDAVGSKEIKGLAFPVPPIAEQRRIAEILDVVDDQVRMTSELLAKLRLQAEGLLDNLVSDIPENQREPLASLCVADICYGIVQSGEFVSDGVPVLSIRDLAGDFETGLHRTDPSIAAQYRRSRVAPGDVLLSIKGTIGRVGVAPKHYVGNISRELARLRFGKQVIPEFARLYFLSREAQRLLDLAVVGTTRAEISIHVLKRFRFPVPSLTHQEHMVNILDSIERRAVAEQENLAKLIALRAGLANDLLRGRVRVAAEVA